MAPARFRNSRRSMRPWQYSSYRSKTCWSISGWVIAVMGSSVAEPVLLLGREALAHRLLQNPRFGEDLAVRREALLAVELCRLQRRRDRHQGIAAPARLGEKCIQE